MSGEPGFDFRKAMGAQLTLGALTGFRIWRYALSPRSLALNRGLYSMTLSCYWTPGADMVADKDPDIDQHGIHAFASYEALMRYMRDDLTLSEALEFSQRCGHDGIVVGKVSQWGKCITHENLCRRSEFAKPTEFLEVYGNEKSVALETLRAQYLSGTI